MDPGIPMLEEEGGHYSRLLPSAFNFPLNYDNDDDDDDEEEVLYWLDPGLWGRLPEKIVERVLARLPIPSFFRMRVVCKTWYRLPFSDSFLEACAGVSSQRCHNWFLFFKPGVWSEAYVFDPNIEAESPWYRMDLSFLPSSYAPVASSGGLLCCTPESPTGSKEFLLCNPLTRACARLPPLLKPRFVPTIGLAVLHHPKELTHAYHVMAAGDDLISPFAVKNLTTEVYDSALQAWRVTGPLPRLCNLASGKSAFVGSSFYCMNYSPFSILAYHIQQASWSQMQAPMKRFLRNPSLLECCGRLVLIAAVEKNQLNVPKSVRIWSLHQPNSGKTGWVEVERMPQALYDDFMMISQEKAFTCIGHGNYILLTLEESPTMLVYDMHAKVWKWSPSCPYLDSTVQGLVGFPYEPRLEASIS